MINKLKIAILALGVMFAAVSCTEKTNIYNIEIENVTVKLNSKELLNTVIKPFGKYASTGATPTDEYEHVFPGGYKAYFVSKETKGEYTVGQLVKVIDVVAGGNTITVPKLNYDIYVTNYEKEGDWYTWNDAIEQLPQTSTEIYLYGKNTINYSTVTEGTVELVNPYAAVMIYNNQWINGTPLSYDTNQSYFSTPSGSWFVLYVRNSNTNTKIPISIAGNPNQHYTLNKNIEANNIYQYTIDGSVPLLEDGDLNIVVLPFEKIIKETIKL